MIFNEVKYYSWKESKKINHGSNGVPGIKCEASPLLWLQETQADALGASIGTTEQSRCFWLQEIENQTDLATGVHIISNHFKSRGRADLGWVSSIDHKWHKWPRFYQCCHSAIHSISLVTRWLPHSHDLAAGAIRLLALFFFISSVKQRNPYSVAFSYMWEKKLKSPATSPAASLASFGHMPTCQSLTIMISRDGLG